LGGFLPHLPLPPTPSFRSVSDGVGGLFFAPSMHDDNPLQRAEAALEEARQAKLELLRRIEAARCAGAKILLTLEDREASTPDADPPSET
jgi:hypothetical protein